MMRKFIIFSLSLIGMMAKVQAQDKPHGKYYIIESKKVTMIEFKSDSISEYSVQGTETTKRSQTKTNFFEKWDKIYVVGIAIEATEKYLVIPISIGTNGIYIGEKRKIDSDSLSFLKKQGLSFFEKLGKQAFSEAYYNQIRKLKKEKDLTSADIADFMDIYLQNMLKISANLQDYKNKTGIDLFEYNRFVPKLCLVDSWIQAGYDPIDILIEHPEQAQNQINIYSQANPEAVKELQSYAAFLNGTFEYIEKPLPPKSPDK